MIYHLFFLIWNPFLPLSFNCLSCYFRMALYVFVISIQPMRMKFCCIHSIQNHLWYFFIFSLPDQNLYGFSHTLPFNPLSQCLSMFIQFLVHMLHFIKQVMLLWWDINNKLVTVGDSDCNRTLRYDWCLKSRKF